MGVPLNIDWQQILLHLFNFAILAGGLYLLLYKPVKNFLEKRTAYYQGLDATANEKLAHAEAMEADYQKQLDQAEAEISQRKAKAAKESELAAAAQMKNAKEQSEKLILAAQQAAQMERKKILGEAREEIAQIAVEATQKLLKADASKIYNEFLDAASKEQGHE